ncbi:MAG TPA: hypothetical protein VFE27_24375 [Acidobacteriaceae bacterium]|jgi:DNA-binding CsgD family transcriptional regulator|nr:hypothetical protein [Acidobacteriaceae bacterium]
MRIDGKVMDRIEGEGMTIKEIATIEGISRAMVWFILQNAYRKIKRNPRILAHLQSCAAIARSQRDKGGKI